MFSPKLSFDSLQKPFIALVCARLTDWQRNGSFPCTSSFNMRRSSCAEENQGNLCCMALNAALIWRSYQSRELFSASDFRASQSTAPVPNPYADGGLENVSKLPLVRVFSPTLSSSQFLGRRPRLACGRRTLGLKACSQWF